LLDGCEGGDAWRPAHELLGLLERWWWLGPARWLRRAPGGACLEPRRRNKYTKDA
jgi:hypothetical protein